MLRHPVPHPVPQPPQAEGRRVHRAVVAGDVPLLHLPLRSGPHHLLVEKVIYPSLGRRPLPQNEPPVKGPPEGAAVPLPHPGRQARVVLHGEVEIPGVALSRLPDPLPVKPGLRPVRIAGEPQLGSLRRAPGAGLLHEGAGHQHHLVQQHPRQGDPLDQGGASLVPAPEQIEPVLPPAAPHREQVFPPPLPALEAQLPQQGHHLPQQTAPHPLDGLAAQGEPLSPEPAHGPQEEGQPHAQGLAAAHRPVTDDGVLRPRPPPGEHLPLLGGQLSDHGSPPPSMARSSSAAPPPSRSSRSSSSSRSRMAARSMNFTSTAPLP